MVENERRRDVPDGSHAILDRISRERKAQKIDALLRIHSLGRFGRVLDVGTGSGYIACCLSRMGYGQEGFYAVDVRDERQVTSGFEFKLIEGTKLPFPEGFFDLVISNHVIEHVGLKGEHVLHLQEVSRCLKPGGVLYFAVPNRWSIIEPHYKLPFVSWLPRKVASAYVRILGRASNYDCAPLSRLAALRLLRSEGFLCKDVTLEAIRLVGQFEAGNFFLRSLTGLPKWFWRIFLFIVPTCIFICKKAKPESL